MEKTDTCGNKELAGRSRSAHHMFDCPSCTYESKVVNDRYDDLWAGGRTRGHLVATFVRLLDGRH